MAVCMMFTLEANFHLRAEQIDGKKLNRNCSEKYSDKDKERLSISLPQ